MRFRRRAIVQIVVVGGLVLTACGTESSSTPVAPPATTVEASSNASDETAVPAPPAAVADPVSNPASDASAAPADERNPGNVYGPYGIYKRVQFPSGSTGTTVSDGVVRGTVNGYLFGASAGQRMSLELLSENAVFDLYAPDDRLLTGGRYAFVDPLEMDGEYLVVVQSEFGNASFDLIVEITWPDNDEGAAEATSCPVGYVEFDGAYPLHICHKGETVTILQERLVSLGYDIAIDGYFGESTQNALAEVFGGVGVIEVPSDLEALCGADC
ncbi:peptidoglycan-binding protein [Ilumatobacter sp.]|uniref:peptidoglycan-binding domain-containing protein n=1 Tax=Ilumatobacter sp. TaxID=1967498 RepID=UPI003751F879